MLAMATKYTLILTMPGGFLSDKHISLKCVTEMNHQNKYCSV